MIAHTEIWIVGRNKFTVKVEKKRGNFNATCSKIPSLITCGKTIKAALDRFMYFSEPFFDDFVLNLPLQERREVCLWMQAPDDPEYVPPKVTTDVRSKAKKPSGSPPNRATEKTSAQGGRFSPASLPRGRAELRMKVSSEPCFP